MNDGTRKQVIEALEKIIEKDSHLAWTGGYPPEPSHNEFGEFATIASPALTALKAIQPRPDVVVAALELARLRDQARRNGVPEDEWSAAWRDLEAALADEQEWEVEYTPRYGDGIARAVYKSEDLARKKHPYATISPVYIPKAKPQPVSREKAIEDALAWYQEQARLCRLIHSEGDTARNALAADGGQRAETALSREIQP